ncbi:MAG: acetylxylan esterase [Opitutaceae bacterium]
MKPNTLLPFLLITGSVLAGNDGAAPISPLPPQATVRIATVDVRVVPDHRDWTYRVGEPVRFSISVVADGTPIDNVVVHYKIGPEIMAPTLEETVDLPIEGLTVEAGTMGEPGFLRCEVSTEVAGRTYKGLATAAFSPELIEPTQTEPEDFDAFWEAGKAALAKAPIEPRLTLLPEACTDNVNVFHVRIRTIDPGWGPPAYVFGIYCEPKKPGLYPAVLRVPGAGVRPYGGDTATAAAGALTLTIGIHGLPVNLPQEVYDALGSGALNGYATANLDNRDRYYYRRVFLSCLRANDFLTGRDNWDGEHLVVAGGSQGGQLAIVTAALDPRVTGLSSIHPAYCDVTGALHGRADGFPFMFRQWTPGVPSDQATPEKIATTAYYDTVNFARRIKVPGYYSWGYNDVTCPPTTCYAAYNQITAQKELGLTLELGHEYTPEQAAVSEAWIRRHLGLAETGS